MLWTCLAYNKHVNMQSCLLVCILVFITCKKAFCFSSPNQSTLDAACQELQLDVPRLQKAIASGHVYQQFDFLNEDQVQFLLNEIQELEKNGQFVASGLSNTAKGASQGFGQYDRSTCVVPWWKDSLTSGDSQPHEISARLQQLRMTLAQVLQRHLSPNLAHECYYSQSKVGSFLPRHMDERHEETKGAKGWLLPSRRSLSWLVYLSDDQWDLDKNGGALTSFPQKQGVLGGSTHNGNLQVGWLLPEEGDSPSQPVYIDSWLKLPDSDMPHCILYVVDDNRVQFISKPFLSDALQGMSVADFILTQTGEKGSLFIKPSLASQFALLEDRPAWENGEIPRGSEAVHICPTRGSLVIFDSVAVPHQVEVIKQGTRTALAGWFHEETQPFPEGFYGEA